MARDRKTTLADRFLALSPHKIGGHPIPPVQRQIRYAQAKVRPAEKFVFDTEASRHVAVVLRDIPELLVEQIQFARAPFELTWIEYDSNVIFEMLNPESITPGKTTIDSMIGLLIDHSRITVIVESFDGSIGVMPIVYHLNTEWPLADQLRFCELTKVSRAGIDQWLWGSVANTFRRQGKLDYLRVLRDTTMVELLIPEDHFTASRAPSLIDSATGDFKNHLALILLLNQPSATQYIRVPSTRGWIGNKPKPYMAYNNIRVTLDAAPSIKLLSEGQGVADLRRRHRVKGHYCHNEAARLASFRHTCIHEWQAADAAWEPAEYRYDTDIDHWFCNRCQGRRWWRAQHERGDAGKGWVDHPTYTVKRNPLVSTDT